MEDNLKKDKKMEDNLIFFLKIRITTSNKIEDDLKNKIKWKTTSKIK